MSHCNLIGITMGDPAGVGPEIICKALAALDNTQRSQVVVIGDPFFLDKANQQFDTGLVFGPAFNELPLGVVPLVSVSVQDSGQVKNGVISSSAGEAAYRCIVRATELALNRQIEVIVTAPINKGALHAAGHHFDGHTGLLAHLTRSKSSFMLLTSDKLSTIHVTTHLSMRNAIERITCERVLATIRAGAQHLQQVGIENPRVAVAGLNPHCGEGGIFGTEELEQIEPAIQKARAEGINVVGAIPGDTVFYRAVRGEFDLVVAQYHDQGHTPAKLLAFDTTVNVSLGLPIRRTSVDHGTAFDIAWSGRADHGNMLAAIAYARRWSAAAQS